MKPLSPHWADQTATRLVSQLKDKDTYVIASGITPSGTVHIGNFREVITVDLVGRALKKLGKNVRFIYSWDDFDTFRKVPQNLPNQEMLEKHLRMPINRVPDPYEKESSYARANEVVFERELEKVGINPEFIYQSKKYESGDYAESIRHALEKREDIKAVLNVHRTSPLADNWLPTTIYCGKCERDEMKSETYEGEWNYAYECGSCGHSETVDIRKTKNLKLTWRTDWPMRWAYEKVDFEPGGKDHSSQGGSFDTGKDIVKNLWNHPAPIYLQYDFVSIKGLDGKMSSSKGVLITLSQALEVYTPQMIRWIFAMQRANHDFSISFDADVIKVYDEFDRCEAQALSNDESVKKNKKWIMTRTVYELSCVDEKIPEISPFRPPFRELCNRLQICDGDAERCFDKFYQNEEHVNKDIILERCKLAWNWLTQNAPEEFKYQLRKERYEIENPELKGAIGLLKKLVTDIDLDSIDGKDLNQKIYDDVIRAGNVDGKEFFKAAYQTLIGRDQGPRLPMFLKEIGRSKLTDLL